jgi:hypothetical protein
VIGIPFVHSEIDSRVSLAFGMRNAKQFGGR